MTGSRLAALLDQATPGPWFYDSYATVHSAPLARQEADFTGVAALWAGTSKFNGGTATNPADARLVALAPDMARLLVDTFAWVEEIVAAMETNSERGAPDEAFALLARFAALDEKAGGA